MAFCSRCNRHFVHSEALEQHEANSSKHHICTACNIDYLTWDDLEDHWLDDPDHFYCGKCEEHFDDEDELDTHLEEEHEYCPECEDHLDVDEDLHEHNRAIHSSHYCVPCKRMFASQNALKNHKNSSIHKRKDVVCLCTRCKSTFISRSALLLHLESGGCRSRVTRQDINRVVQEYDRNNVITNPGRMITNGTVIATIATSASWNGGGYECYLCHNTFRALNALNQHLASPRHDSKLYVCPLNTCRANFSTLSALCQHIESESCGVARFAVVQNTMDQVMGQMRSITL